MRFKFANHPDVQDQSGEPVMTATLCLGGSNDPNNVHLLGPVKAWFLAAGRIESDYDVAVTIHSVLDHSMRRTDVITRSCVFLGVGDDQEWEEVAATVEEALQRQGEWVSEMTLRLQFYDRDLAVRFKLTFSG